MIESLSNTYSKLGYGGVELGGESPSTVKTFNSIMKKYPNDEFFYLFGADKLQGIPHWTNIDLLINKLSFLVYPRNGFDVESIIKNSPFLMKYHEKIHVLKPNQDTFGISSTEVRTRLFNGLDYKELMDEKPYQILSGYGPDYFKELTAEEVIEKTLLYGGRFSGNAARKLVYNENMNIFSNWDEKRFGNRDWKVSGTKVYSKPFTASFCKKFETIFDCKNIDCVDAAKELVDEDYSPAILNLADRFKPCGGYREGLGAQEESLCQSSTLSQSLYQFADPKLKCFKESGVKNVPNVYPMDINYGGIYSPNVCFFRNGIDKYYSLRTSPFECGVISVASLSNRFHDGISDKNMIAELQYFDESGYLNKSGKEIERNKIRTIYRIAIENRHNALVLGAFGCGVFNLKCDEVARLFTETYQEPEFFGAFKKIVFAIYEGKGTSRKVVGPNGKFKPFYDTFKN